MDTLSNTVLVILTVLYTLLVMVYGRIFARGSGGLSHHARTLLIITLGLQIASIGIRSWSLGACPLNHRPEFLTLVAFSIAATYFIVELSIGERSTGVFAMTPAFIFQIIATVDVLGAMEGPAGRPLGSIDSIHIFAAIVAFSAVALGSVYGLLYLFLYASIKRGKFGLFYQKLPPLDTLSRINFIVTAVAFGAISITAGLGLWKFSGSGAGAISLLHPEVVLTFILWLLYGGCVLGRPLFGFGGKRLAYTTVLGLAVILGILLRFFLAPGFHY